MLAKLWQIFAIKEDIKAGNWYLEGYDTFSRESYPLAGPFSSEKAAKKAAQHELNKLHKLQPSSNSGGQSPNGIQDRIFIVRPDGSSYRYL